MLKSLKNYFSSKEKILLLVLLLTTFSLRFINLGYSDYISDEPGTFFYRGGKKNPEMNMWEFSLSQRKGPLQLLIGYIPYTLNGNNYNNELGQRLPFALYSFGSIYIFYLLVKKLTDNYSVAFFSAFLFSVNGLIVAYGRTAQYQNLNFFFSFASLYFYADLWKNPKNIMKSSILGTVLFCISFYAHWFAVFILIPIFFFYIMFLLNKRYSGFYKFKVTLLNIGVGILILAPFYVPYFQYMYSHVDANVTYAEKTLGLTNPFLPRRDLEQFNLYNPLLTYYLYIVGGLIGSLYLILKRQYFFVRWFILVFLSFRILVAYSGLHFYNFFFPLVVLVSYGFYYLISKLGLFKYIVGLILLFLFLQSYLIYVDFDKEYPFEQETILSFTTPQYSHEDDFRHKTGFTHNREWQKINAWVNEQNEKNNENFGYYTNEYPQIAKYYMDTEFKSDRDFYAIGIKRPQSFANDYSFPQIKNKYTVHKITNDQGETVAKIYRIEGNRDEKR